MTNESFKKFLGIKILWLDSNVINLSQTVFIKEFLKHFDMKNSAPVSTPIVKDLQLDLKFTSNSLIDVNKEHYQ